MTELVDQIFDDVMRGSSSAPKDKIADQIFDDVIGVQRSGTPQGGFHEMTGDEWERRALQEQEIERDPIGAYGSKFVQGYPFVGEYADEIAGAVGGDAAKDRMRMLQEGMDTHRPKTSMGLQVGGGITATAPLVGLTAPAAITAAPSSVGGKVLLGMGAGAATGAFEGAVSGYGAGNDGDRVQSAKERSFWGGAIGGGLGAAAPAVGSAVSTGLTFLANRPTKFVAKQLSAKPEAVRALSAALEGDDLAKAMNNIGPDGMVADAGPNARALLDYAIQKGGPSARQAGQAVEQRASDQVVTIRQTLDDVLGPAQGRASAGEAVRKETAGARSTAYDAAYNTPIDYASPQGRKIEALLMRIPAKQLKLAMDAANDLMEYDGLPRQVFVEIADDGSRTISQKPGVLQMDYLKKALDGIARDETDVITGKISGKGLFAQRIARDVRKATIDATTVDGVSPYAQALETAADSLSREAAIEAGYKMLGRDMTPDRFRKMSEGWSGPEKEAARTGLRAYIEDAMSAVERTITDGNVDAREAQLIIKKMSSGASRRKIVDLLGLEDAKSVFAALDSAAQALGTRAGIARNSATAARQMLDEQIKELSAPGFWREVGDLSPVKAGRRISQILTNNTREAQALQRTEIVADIARILTDYRGPRAKQVIAYMQELQAGKPLSEAQARAIGNAASQALISGAYPLLSQSTN